ncbi:cyclic AMP-responsive element-binding 3 1 isoform X2 [Pelobates cultripes]|uniref:Cyclic AMP-responsive element-binding 3 1 isoform X2 n=2 Tax=Pelobates cultripes TaxID=61616 RepID=A0AAD1WW46_PELCU|nr:cyclic AMP-responsive element-binding 3 1 isoform X2 [Pelobates cultripes]
MESVTVPQDRSFHSPFLELEDFTEADFMSNVHFSEALDDFSNELFNSFFDDPPLLDRDALLDMDVESPAPAIQVEHSYSLSGDSAPQSPAFTIKEEDEECPNEPGSAVWALEHELCSLLVKQEHSVMPQAEATHRALPSTAMEPEQGSGMLQEEENFPRTPISNIKAEPGVPNHFLNVPADVLGMMPLTPPSSHSSDSDGSQSPRSLPPPSPARPAPRSSHAISSSPLLTAPHKLQGTSGPLMLTEEERRTLVAEGYPIPTKLPLSKTEEKALKRVRRKIKNKISAQESRRKKKEYVECLEKKVESFTSQNSELWKKVETLENANRSLLQQLQKLQALVTGKVTRPCKLAATQTGTCLMSEPEISCPTMRGLEARMEPTRFWESRGETVGSQTHHHLAGTWKTRPTRGASTWEKMIGKTGQMEDSRGRRRGTEALNSCRIGGRGRGTGS